MSFSAKRVTAIAFLLSIPGIAQQLESTLPGCERAQSSQFESQGRAALLAGKASLATTLYRQAREACPEDRRLLLEISRSLSAERKLPEAIAAAQEFLDAEPNSAAGLLVLANALFMAQRIEDSSKALDRLLKIEPENAKALLLKANSTYLLGRNEEAEKILLKLLDRNPADADAAYSLGRMYYMQSRGDYAMGMFLRVVRLDPKHYRAWDNLGLCYDASGNPEMAIRSFLTAIKLVDTDHPEYDWPYANLSDVLLRQNRYQEAYQAATQAAKRNPQSARDFYLGGQALVKLERPDDAQKWLERAVALDPTYPDALYALGQLYMRAGEKEKGVETLKRFRELKAKAPTTRR